MERIGDRIRRLRGDQLWTQSDLAHAAGVSQQSVTQWEHYLAVPTSTSCRRLARAFGITPFEFEDGADFTKPTTANSNIPIFGYDGPESSSIANGVAGAPPPPVSARPLRDLDDDGLSAVCDELLASAHNTLLVATDLARELARRRQDPRYTRPDRHGSDRRAHRGVGAAPVSKKA